MSNIIPIFPFICLKYYELININTPLTYNHQVILYSLLFIFAVLTNVFTIFAYMNGDTSYLRNIQLWIYTIMCWGLFVIIVLILEIPEMQGMIQPFSNTFGYFYVKKDADIIINNMLTPYDNTTDHEIKRILRQINADNSLLLNSMNLTNVNDIWEKFVGKPVEEGSNKNDLIQIIKNKSFVGKCIWYIYSGILVYFLLAYYNTKSITK
jgi:hypothetical protein